MIRRSVFTSALVLVAVLGTAAAAHGADSTSAAGSSTTLPPVTAADWPSAGHDLGDSHSAPAEHTISPSTVGGLRPKWVATTGGNVAGTPTVVGGSVYATDQGGRIRAVDAASGRVRWDRAVGDVTGVPGDLSRNSPAYWQGELVSGDGWLGNPLLTGARVFGVRATDGGRLWSTVVDSTPAAIVTGSPVVADGVAYVGVSSKSESESSSPTFRGSVVALDAATGRILWRTAMVPPGYTGGAVWGSHPVLDLQHGHVVVGVGNNYTTPAGVCSTPGQTGCTPPSAADHIDSVVALDIATGKIAWSRSTLPADTWTGGAPVGPDSDFGAGPNLVTTTIAGHRTTLIGIGQKSGTYWAIDPATGRVVWKTAVGPGGDLGGIQWGTATDGSRIYAAVTNADGTPTTITSADGTTSTTTHGLWAALDPASGRILWQTAAPASGLPYSSLSVANGVLYSGTLDPSGPDMFALDARTGAIRWSFASGGSVVDGPAVVNGVLYWGSGYDTQPFGFPFDGRNDQLFAFALGR